MGSNEEQMQLLHAANVDHVSYALVIYSIAFLIYFYTVFLIRIYMSSGKNSDNIEHKLNGINGDDEERRLRAAGEFELQELLDEDEAGEEDAHELNERYTHERIKLEV